MNRYSFESFLSAFMILLFILGFWKLPYGYYEFLRVATTIGFILLTISKRTNKFPDDPDASKLLSYVFIGCALLMNPIVKVELSRAAWTMLDGIMIMILVFTITNNSE